MGVVVRDPLVRLQLGVRSDIRFPVALFYMISNKQCLYLSMGHRKCRCVRVFSHPVTNPTMICISTFVKLGYDQAVVKIFFSNKPNDSSTLIGYVD